MPHIFISTVALCANLYRCAPLIVGDKFSDARIMSYLGAKVTTDYPEPNSAPMYVMFATLRSVLDALEEIGWELKQIQAVQGYYTCVMYKRGDPEDKEEDVGQEVNTEDIRTSSKSSQTLNLTKQDSGRRGGLKKESSKNLDQRPSSLSISGTYKTNEDKATNTPNELDPETMENAPKPLYEQKPEGSLRSLNKKERLISLSQPVSGGSSDELPKSSKEALPKLNKKSSFIERPKEDKLNTVNATASLGSMTKTKHPSVDDVMERVISEPSPVRTKSQLSHDKKLSHHKDHKEPKKKSVTDKNGEDKEVKKKPAFDVRRKSSSLESEGGSPYAPKKMNRASKRESTSSTVKEIFRD